MSNATNITKQVLKEVLPKFNGLTMKVHKSEKDIHEMLPLKLMLAGGLNNYHIYHGRSKYVVDSIMFYNAEGIEYPTKWGYLDGAHGVRMRAISFLNINTGFGRDLNDIVKVNAADTRFKKAYAENEIFFVSKGKDSYGELSAILYIPSTYLDSMGYQVIKTTETFDYSIREYTVLYTPMFQINISSDYRKVYEHIKADMVKELAACEDIDSIKAYLCRWAGIAV